MIFVIFAELTRLAVKQTATSPALPASVQFDLQLGAVLGNPLKGPESHLIQNLPFGGLNPLRTF